MLIWILVQEVLYHHSQPWFSPVRLILSLLWKPVTRSVSQLRYLSFCSNREMSDFIQHLKFSLEFRGYWSGVQGSGGCTLSQFCSLLWFSARLCRKSSTKLNFDLKCVDVYNSHPMGLWWEEEVMVSGLFYCREEEKTHFVSLNSCSNVPFPILSGFM